MIRYSDFHSLKFADGPGFDDIVEEIEQLDEISLRTATAVASFAAILAQSQKLKGITDKLKRTSRLEDKIDALADGLNLLSTKLTATAALGIYPMTMSISARLESVSNITSRTRKRG